MGTNTYSYSIQFSGLLLPEFDTKKSLYYLFNILKLDKKTIRMIVLSKHKDIISGISNNEANYFIDLFLENGLIFYKRKHTISTNTVCIINNSSILLDLHHKYIKNEEVEKEKIKVENIKSLYSEPIKNISKINKNNRFYLKSIAIFIKKLIYNANIFYKYKIKSGFKQCLISLAVVVLLVFLLPSILRDASSVNFNTTKERSLSNHEERFINSNVTSKNIKEYKFEISTLKFLLNVPDTWTAKKLSDGCRLESNNDPTQSINLQVSYNSKNLKPINYADYLINDIENVKTDDKIMRFKYIYERNGEIFVDATVDGVFTTFGYRNINNHILVTTVTGDDRIEISNILSTLIIR